jgi:hypothetical protein
MYLPFLMQSQVICWVLGEYGTADGTHSASYIIGRLYDVVEAHPGDDLVKVSVNEGVDDYL